MQPLHKLKNRQGMDSLQKNGNRKMTKELDLIEKKRSIALDKKKQTEEDSAVVRNEFVPLCLTKLNRPMPGWL